MGDVISVGGRKVVASGGFSSKSEPVEISTPIGRIIFEFVFGEGEMTTELVSVPGGARLRLINVGNDVASAVNGSIKHSDGREIELSVAVLLVGSGTKTLAVTYTASEAS